VLTKFYVLIYPHSIVHLTKNPRLEDRLGGYIVEGHVSVRRIHR
jgi:riboflavin synthase alpha subunit